MIFKYIILIFVFIFTYGQAKAEPACETFYNKMYNDKVYPRDSDATDVKQLVIGFNLKTEWNDKKDDFILKTNNDGYYVVGKITKLDLVDKIQMGDVLLSINGKDVRKSFDEDEIIAGNISDFYKENEKINFKFLRNVKGGEEKIFDIETTNVYHDYNQPNIDFYVNNIDINEKKGTIDVSFAGEFWREYNTYWKINNWSHELLVFDRQDGSLPTDEDYLKDNINSAECFFLTRNGKN